MDLKVTLLQTFCGICLVFKVQLQFVVESQVT